MRAPSRRRVVCSGASAAATKTRLNRNKKQARGAGWKGMIWKKIPVDCSEFREIVRVMCAENRNDVRSRQTSRPSRGGETVKQQ